MRKHFYIESSKCVLCDDEPNEHLKHLFFPCDFSHNFWMSIGIEWNTDHSINKMLDKAKNQNKHTTIQSMLDCWMLVHLEAQKHHYFLPQDKELRILQCMFQGTLWHSHEETKTKTEGRDANLVRLFVNLS